MDLRLYYQKIRDAESKIAEPYPVVVSRETQDGGKAGVMTEVPRSLAAKMTVEGTAHQATAVEAQEFRQAQADAKRTADEANAASRVQLTVVSATELSKLKGIKTPAKDQA